MTDFAAVDIGDAHGLVEMMDATDAWCAVRAARARAGEFRAEVSLVTVVALLR